MTLSRSLALLALASVPASAATLSVDNTVACSDMTGSPAYCTIQAAVNASVAGDVVSVAAGTYLEDVLVNRSITLQGAGLSATTIVGAMGGGSSTIQVAAPGVVIDGFTITRDGNTVATWNGPLNSAGVAVQGLTSSVELRNSYLTGLRTGVDINNSNGNWIHNNVIDFNRTGMIFRNQTDNTVVEENFITNNWTVGVLFLDASGGTNVPLQQALGSAFNDNDLSGNWYGAVVDRQAGGALPAPGTTNLKDFTNNWWGTTTPSVSTANSAEPGYAAQIPVAYGGTATAPGGQPDILGPASANILYMPVLTNGVDGDVETTPGRGTVGFQPARFPVEKDQCKDGGWMSWVSATGDPFPNQGQCIQFVLTGK